MASPFPGMDPYLEAFGYWEDFHDSFLTYFRDRLRGGLPDAYTVFIQERVTSITLPAKEKSHSVPDIGVTVSDDYRPDGGAVATLPATDIETATLEHDLEEWETEAYLEITRRSDQQLITVIELLSPSNKVTRRDRKSTLAKQAAASPSAVHLVEIDLLIRGSRLPMLKPLPVGDYYAFVSRAEERPRGQIYARGMCAPCVASDSNSVDVPRS